MALSNRYHRLRYFCADAWDEWRHSLGVNLLALSTLVAALFLAALVLLLVSNIERRVEELRDDVRVEVYLRDEADEAGRADLGRRLQGDGRVARIQYVDKQEALQRYSEWAGELATLAEELETNPLPASFEVFLVPGEEAAGATAAIAASLRGDPLVEDVRFNEDWRQRLESVLAVARVGGGAVVAVVFVAVVFVMGSVLRLAVLARRDEIEIMQLVGATPGFIRGPYLVAGAAQGLFAAGVALGLLEVVRRVGLGWADAAAAALADLAGARPLTPALAGVLLLCGLVVGVSGSYVSVRQTT